MKSVLAYTLATAALLGLTSAVPLTKRDGYQVNYYSDTSCNNFAGSWEGANQGIEGTYEYPNKYIGAIIVVYRDTWTDTISINKNYYDPFWYDGACGSSTVRADYYGDAGCMKVDETVTEINMGFTVCDVSGADQSY